MDEETVAGEAMASNVAETPQPEETDVPEVAESDGPDTDEPELETEAEVPEDELIELRYGSNALNIPKGALSDDEVAKLESFLGDTQADYTRKTQEAAEERKAVQAQREALDGLSSLNDELLSEFSKGQQVKAEIERLQQVNLNELWQSNPDQARQVSDNLSSLNAQFQQVIQNIDQAESGLKAAQAQERQRQIEAGKATVEKMAPGFTEKVPEVIDYVVSSYGIDRSLAEAEWSLNPVTAIMAQKAMLYDRMQAKAATKPAVKPAAPVMPTKGRGTRASVDPDKMPIDEWMKRRNKQRAG